MKNAACHHLAVILLTGWVLLVPPWDDELDHGSGDYNDRAPLSAWKNLHGYDTAPECEQARASMIREAAEHPGEPKNAVAVQRFLRCEPR